MPEPADPTTPTWLDQASGPWPAPGKLNLFLHVTGRRSDGYHTLQTAFQFLDYADQLFFLVRSSPAIRRIQPLDGVPEKNDLTLRAAHLLRERCGLSQGVEILLEKRLPTGGGLGGGSSDAATTLLVLNGLWGAGLDNGQLAELGAELGADVPIFLLGTAAWGEGIGSRLTPAEFPEPWYLVVTPPVSVSTADIFSAPELTRNSPPIRISDFLAHGGRNDCEATVRHRYPLVGDALDWLGRHAGARLTGTGASVFAAFQDVGKAQDVLALVPPEWHAVITRGRNESPLIGALRDYG